MNLVLQACEGSEHETNANPIPWLTPETNNEHLPLQNWLSLLAARNEAAFRFIPAFLKLRSKYEATVK